MKRLLILALLLGSIQVMAQQPAPLAVGNPIASYTLKLATGAGTAYSLPASYNAQPSKITWTVTFKTAAPGAQTTNLEGSIDNINWYTLDTSTNLSYTSDTQSGEMRHVANKPIRYIRCNLAVWTVGGSAGTTCTLMVSGS